MKLSKEMQNPRSMNISTEIDAYSPQKMFHLTSVNIRRVQLNVKRLLEPTSIMGIQWHSLPVTNYQTEETSIFLRIASGNLDVKVNSTFSAEMERTTTGEGQKGIGGSAARVQTRRPAVA